MGKNLEWFQKAFYNISHDQDVISNLSEIKIALSVLNSSQLKYNTSSLNLSEIFDCLNSSAKNQIELACEVLKTFLSALDPAVILSQYGVAVIRALKHPNVDVKQLVLEELNRAACESDLAPRLSQEQELLLCVAECVAHEEVAVARSSIQFLVRLGSSTTGLAAVYSPAMLHALAAVSQTNDTNRFRVYEIAVEISVNSIPGLEASKASNILESLLSELKKDDVLLLLNTLEFITKLALTYHGFGYLESHGVVHHLSTQINNIENNPLASLVLSGLIKFFGNVAQLRPQETFRDYPRAIETIFKTLNSDDQSLVCVALETIGFIGTTPAGKRTLHKQGTVMKGVMKKLDEIVLKWPSESRVRGLNSLANLLRLELSEQESELLGILEEWFTEMGPPAQVMTHIVDMARQPFPDIKLATMLLVQVLAEQPWSQRLIHDTPDMVCQPFPDIKLATMLLVQVLAEQPWNMACQPFPDIKLATMLLVQVLAEQPWSQRLIHDTPDMVCQPFPDIKLATMLLLQVLAEQPWSQRLIHDTPVMIHVVDMVCQPFPDIKLATMLLLQVLAEQPWSQRLIHDTPGLVELLLDREGSSTMQEKAARFAVINILAESPTSETIFGEETVKRFKRFTEEGAVYVPIQTEVAIEKAD
ncbi:26S proteasome non-ATPase regulatory subunit 5 [Macrosteles quadrilineatus]|uniref:26S proteasome non-ATPase regulatory subunit 5 n=1 Tax=Macrosteles quadrilineatus TaxID=74068 RepID=UPI0023E20635|nr:26S proteasome non-ATPase regulatory subunit 5 [Macrosteles quadrilineatus]